MNFSQGAFCALQRTALGCVLSLACSVVAACSGSDDSGTPNPADASKEATVGAQDAHASPSDAATTAQDAATTTTVQEAGVASDAPSPKEAATDASTTPDHSVTVEDSGGAGPDVAFETTGPASEAAVSPDAGVQEDAATSAPDGGDEDGGQTVAYPYKTNFSAPACRSCLESNHCAQALDPQAACNAITGKAAQGEGANMDRSALCMEVWTCISTHLCGYQPDFNVLVCYTGTDTYTTNAAGECKQPIEWASETTNVAAIEESFYDPTFATGRATESLQCVYNWCPDECIVPSGSGTGAADGGGHD